MEVHDLIRNQLLTGENVIISARQEPRLTKFLIFLVLGQALVLGIAIGAIIMVEDSFVEFWQILADRAAFLPYLLIGSLITATFLVINTLAKQRFHKDLRAAYAFTTEAIIVVYEATEEHPEPAIGRCSYNSFSAENYEYLPNTKVLVCQDILFNNPVFDRGRTYRFYLGHEANTILELIQKAQNPTIENSTSSEEV